MSTRCQIAFYESEPKDLNKFKALIYRHSDGYPEGVLPEIKPFLKKWKNGRGLSDTEYVSARLLQHLCNSYDLSMENSIYAGTLGHGICKDFHGDIEFLYAIYPNKIDVYSIEGECFDTAYFLKNINKAKKIESIEL